MHLLLTDLLACPRCGTGFGLILLADTVENRRVLEGRLGCSNCRESYPVRGGYADLRLPGQAWEERAGEVPADAAVRWLALAGVRNAGFMLVLGAGAEAARGLGGVVAGMEAVVLHPDAAEWSEAPGVSRIGAGVLPFHDKSWKAVVASAPLDAAQLAAVARIIAPAGRLVIENAAEDIELQLKRAGLTMMLHERGTAVAVRK